MSAPSAPQLHDMSCIATPSRSTFMKNAKRGVGSAATPPTTSLSNLTNSPMMGRQHPSRKAMTEARKRLTSREKDEMRTERAMMFRVSF